MASSSRYPIEVFYSEEDGGFIALAKDLAGCSAFGESQEQAVSEIQDAIKAWIEAARAAGNPVPEPTVHIDEPLPSGRILLRMPRSLHASLIESARREAVSLNQYVVSVLSLTTGAAFMQAATHVAPRGMVADVIGSDQPITRRVITRLNVGSAYYPTTWEALNTGTTWQRVEEFETAVHPRGQLDVRKLPAGEPVLVEDR